MFITIFDFDDTLFSTTHSLTEEQLDYTELSNSINLLLELAIQQSDLCYIITNAEISWIKLCIEKYLKDCDLFTKNIKFFSTVDNGYDIDEVVQNWKKDAFLKVLEPYISDSQKHDILSIGDSEHDRKAIINLGEKYPNVNIKSVLFIEKPKIDYLIRQHKTIQDNFNYLKTYEGRLDLQLTFTIIA